MTNDRNERVASLLASSTSVLPNVSGPKGPYGGGTYAPTASSAHTFYGPTGPYGGGTYAPTTVSGSEPVTTFRAGELYGC